VGVHYRNHRHRRLGRDRADVSFFRYLAAYHQHRHHHRNVSNGVPDSNTQNRDGKAIQLKLDELIRALEGARNKLVDLENLSDDDLKKLQKEFQRLQSRSQETDTHIGTTES
jgi:Low affinity iron permease